MRVEDLPDVAVVACDTETSGLHPDDGARVASVGVAWDGGSAGFSFDQGVRDKLPSEQLSLEGEEDANLPEEDWVALLDWLEGRSLVMHNAKFDLTMLRAGTRHWPGRDLSDSLAWCSMVACRVLEPLESASLDAAARRAGSGGKEGLDEIKSWLKSRKLPVNRYDLAPWELVRPYVVADAEETLKVRNWQLDRDWAYSERRRMSREMDLLRTLYLMESRGVAYDADQSLAAAEKLERAASEIEASLPFEPTNAGAKDWFFGQRGMVADRVSEKTGKPSLDEEQIRKWSQQGVEFAKPYWQASAARRAVSMWYRGYPDKLGLDGRLRTVYKQTRVKSGRMSVERVQLQAMPKGDKLDKLPVEVPGVRKLLRAPEGRGLWNLDLSQAELRVAAEYARCETMLELLAEGADMHGVTCKRVMGVEEDDPLWKEKRDIAKRLTFGAIFQIGGRTFQATLSKLADIHLPLDECTDLVRQWRRTYPEFGVAYRRAEQRAKRKGSVRLLPGTDYELLSWFGPREYPNTAWNRMVQGSLAEFFKAWMVETERQVPGAMVLTVHDSVVLELPEDEGDEIAARVAERGAEMATRMFMREETGVKMPVDVERYA